MVSIRSLDMGVPCCSFCPGIGDYHRLHGRVRDEQGEAGGLPGAQEEAQREQTGDAEQADQALPTRRGKHGGLREIERTILKENMN